MGAIVRSEKNIPVQFRQIFAVVRECIREEFPIKMENLAAVVSSQMLNGLHASREAYEEGVDSFQNLEYMDEHVTDDLEQLKHVIAPVQNLVQMFASTVQTLSVQLKKMMSACESLEGALDPSSPAARWLLFPPLPRPGHHGARVVRPGLGLSAPRRAARAHYGRKGPPEPVQQQDVWREGGQHAAAQRLYHVQQERGERAV